MKKCLNCGNDCYDRFCPKCGQSTATGRTTWRSFSLTSLLEMLRFQGRNLHTCGELLLHPWTVIANYTAGRRVRYSSPLLFLLTLAILGTLLSSWAGLEDHDDRSSYLLRFHSFSSGMFTVCMLPPAILSLRIVYRKYGIKRYNTPELLIAGIYLSALSFLIDIILLPFDAWIIDTSGTNFTIFLVYCSVCVFKAFPIRPLWKAELRFIWFVILTGLFLGIYILALEEITKLILGPIIE